MEREFASLKNESESGGQPAFEGQSGKNRFRDILPLQFNMATPDGLPFSGSNYFNGNYMLGKGGNVNFIVTQSPLKSTIEDFWRVVVLNNVQTVVGRCPFTAGFCQIERLSSDCLKYFPLYTNQEVRTAGFAVRCVSVSNVNSLFRESILAISCAQKDEVIHNIRHIYVYSWPDHSTLASEKQKLLLSMVLQMQKGLQEKPECPVLVHCTAGVGLSGVLLSIFDLYNDFLSQPQETSAGFFSVYDTVFRLRQMRPFIVQTHGQYVFIYKFIDNFLK